MGSFSGGGKKGDFSTLGIELIVQQNNMQCILQQVACTCPGAWSVAGSILRAQRWHLLGTPGNGGQAKTSYIAMGINQASN